MREARPLIPRSNRNLGIFLPSFPLLRFKTERDRVKFLLQAPLGHKYLLRQIAAAMPSSTSSRFAISFAVALAMGMSMGTSQERTRVNEATSDTNTQLPDLPLAITSFGADRAGDALYVYGGHHGRAHHYSTKGQSGELLRLNLNSPKSWDVIAKGPKRQGLALIAHQGTLYRLGGFEARNAEGKDHDLWSVADCAQFNTRSGKWEARIDMPTERSSFDAVLVGDAIYVVGGWMMQGEKETIWRDDAYALDLTKTAAGWKAIARPPFKRRALCVGTRDGKVYAIGGMQPNGKVTAATSIYDPVEDAWSEGPKLPGEEMEGFGPACCTIESQLYVSTSSGKLLKLSPDGKTWQPVAELPTGRFFHQMLPLSQSRLVNIAGAHMEEGRFKDVEVVDVDREQ